MTCFLKEVEGDLNKCYEIGGCSGRGDHTLIIVLVMGVPITTTTDFRKVTLLR